MKKILVVDDEKTFLDSLVSALEAADDQFYVMSARNGRKAVDMLESESFDLVITDLKMPEMDGFELLAFMNSHYPSTPAIVMSAFGSPETMSKIRAFSPLSFLNKPFKLEELLKVVHEGIGRKESVHGSLMGISLTNFLQLIEMEKKSCLLEVKVPRGERGYIYCSNGELYDAFFEDVKSEEAVIRMLSLEKVDVSFKNLPKKRILKRINKNTLSLIMDATSQREGLVPKGKETDEGVESDSKERETASEDGPEKDEKAPAGKVSAVRLDKEVLKDAIDAIKNDLGDGLMSIDFFMAEKAESLAGDHSDPEIFELINRLMEFITVELESSGQAGIGRYYIMELADGNIAVTILHGEYRCRLVVREEKIDPGHLIKDIIPMIIDSLDEALTY